MTTHALRNLLLSLFLVVAILLSSVLPLSGRPALAQGGHAPDALETALLAQLERASGTALRVSYHSETGKVRFLGGEPGRALTSAFAGADGATPEAAARAFLASYGALFGLRDPNTELAVLREQTLADGRTFARFQQQYRGVPVLGGELIVQSAADRAILSANGELLPDLDLDVTPTVASARAREIALSAVAKEYELSVDELSASEPELWIYNPALLGDPGIRMNALVWRLEVTPNGLLPIRELVLVDAHLGAVALRFNQIDHALNRVVYDNNNKPAAGLPGNGPVRSEGDPASGIADVDLAYQYAGDTYDFFFDEHGRDSLDGAGMTLVSTTRYCPKVGACPYENAFWNGEQMVYGDRYASADDVVGHELTHGVTDFSSSLFYWYQSGAINESLSDIWGEFIDQTNGAGDDTAGVKWLLGEEIPNRGAIRDMQDPTAFGDPDKIGSGNYYCGELDSGGVHTNSGVNNKAAYLMTDGDTFNGSTVTGLGISKVADLYYEVQTNLLTSGSDYQDLYDALIQAGYNLGYSAADRQEIQNALDAVEMNQLPCSHPADAPVCDAGLSPVYLFNDDLENTVSGNWTSSAIVGTDYFFYPQNSHPFAGFDATNTTSGHYNLWGYDVEETADFYMAMTSDIALPSDAYLRFNHAWAFEDNLDGSIKYDGGVVEYSTDGGASWSDAGPLFTHNGYNDTLKTGERNPLEGRDAFTGVSFGYTASRIDLSGLAGDSVRFRFRIGTDFGGWAYGWFIDDIRLYTCAAISPGISITPESLTVGEPSGSQSFNVALDTMPSASVTIGLSTSNAECSVSPSSLTLTPAFWDRGLRATVTAMNDDRADGAQTCTIQMAAATSADSDYNGLNPDDVAVTVQDDDTAGVTVSKSAVNVAEGGADATYTLVLTSEPLNPVTITLATGGEARVSPTTISFTAANWDTPQTVSVTAVDDSDAEGDHSDTVEHTASSTDAGYNGIAIGDVTVTISDDEVLWYLYLPVMNR